MAKKKNTSKKTSSRNRGTGNVGKRSVQKTQIRGQAGNNNTDSITMADLLKKYGDETSNYNQGDMVEGTVVEINSDNVILDVAGKNEGIVAEKAFAEAKDFIKTLKVGDKITARVLVTETPEGYTVLSFRRAMYDVAWSKIEKAQKKQTPLPVYGKSVKSAGVIVDIEGMSGFIPNSQLGEQATEDPGSLVGEYFKAVIIDADRENQKIILSERVVSDEESIEEQKKAMNKLKVGELYEGEVTTIADFGCFVSILTKLTAKEVGKGAKKGKTISVEGLVHISELSWDKVKKVSDVVSEGDKVNVRVIGIADNKLALSIKQAKEDPWDKSAKKYEKDKKVKGIVRKLSDFGVFVRLEPGIEGLIHLTKIPPDQKLKVGDEVNVYIEEIDAKNKKISLGLVLTAKPVGYR